MAVALAVKPEVLLLDEPTSALDTENTQRVEFAIKECGATLIVVTHDPDQPSRLGAKTLTFPFSSSSLLAIESEA